MDEKFSEAAFRLIFILLQIWGVGCSIFYVQDAEPPRIFEQIP